MVEHNSDVYTPPNTSFSLYMEEDLCRGGCIHTVMFDRVHPSLVSFFFFFKVGDSWWRVTWELIKSQCMGTGLGGTL